MTKPSSLKQWRRDMNELSTSPFRPRSGIGNDMQQMLRQLDTRWGTSDVTRLFILLYALSLFVNICFGFAFRFKPSVSLLDMDEQEYWNIATQILDGTFEISARRTPAFPLFLAGLRALHLSFLSVQVVAASIYSLAAPLLFLVVCRVSSSTLAGLVSALWLTIWPTAIFYGTSLYSETVAMPVFLLALLILPMGTAVRDGLPKSPIWMYVAAGAVLGLAAHVRPMYLLFTPFLAAIILCEAKQVRVASVRIFAAAAGFIIVVGPWSVYQTNRFGHPIILTSNGGETLAGGLNPNIYAMNDDAFTAPSGRRLWNGPGKWIDIQETGYLSREELALPYDVQDKVLRARTFEWITANPGKAVYLEFRKLTYMWGIYPIMQNGLVHALFGNMPTLALLFGALWLAVTDRHTSLRLVRFAILPIFVSAVALISWGSWRFRQSADAGLIAFVVVSLYWRFLAVRASPIADTHETTPASHRTPVLSMPD
jgi:4-amino-4-deoxy-L-arabinose transferase-like glycosyltransferase